MARSYVKIYGPPILKSLKSLEKVAVEMSKKTTMKYYSTLVEPISPADLYGGRLPGRTGVEDVLRNYTANILPEIQMPTDQKVKMLSKSGDMLGEYDFFFEWGENPTKAQVQELIGMLDDALADCGCRYTIVTK